MNFIIDTYDTKIFNYTNGSINDNILNKMPIYIINLEDNISRRNYINFMMSRMKINYKLVIVKRITDDIYDSIKKYTRLSKEKLGCVLSHLYCIKQGIDTECDKFVIFEDDIIFHKKFTEIFTDELLNLNFDMLMLGACDFNFHYNINYKKTITKELDIYTPFKIALGAHANIYSKEFAKKIYNYKISNIIKEFDCDFGKFYGRNSNIFICYPNLVITELSTTNLNHNFSNEYSMKKYIKSIFDNSFKYKDYNYITIDFINYSKNIEQDMIFTQLVELYINHISFQNSELKNMICEGLLNSGYTIEDIKSI